MNLNIMRQTDCKADYFPLGRVGKLGLSGKIPGAVDADEVGACLCRKGTVLGPNKDCIPTAAEEDAAFPNTYNVGFSCGADHASADLTGIPFVDDRVRTALGGLGFTKFCRPNACPKGYTEDAQSGQCAQALPDGSRRLVRSGFMLNPSAWWFGVGNVLLICVCITCICCCSLYAAAQ